MRRVSDVAHPDDPGLFMNPGEIIARASAACTPRPGGDETDERRRDAGRGRDAPQRRARRAVRERVRLVWQYGSRVAAVLALVTALLWLWRSDAAHVVYRHAAATVQGWQHEATARVALTLDTVVVEGRERTPRDAVRAAIGLRRGDSLIGTDPWAIRRRVEALPWVKSAAVERRPPGTLVVKVTERTAIARFRDGSAMRLIDEAGAVIGAAPDADHQALLLVTGAGGPQATPALLKLLERESALARQVVSATRHGQRRWDLVLESGATVRLPEGHARAAWSKFAELNRQHGLPTQGAIVYDMRLPDRLVIRAAAKSAAPKTPATPAKNDAARKPGKTG